MLDELRNKLLLLWKIAQMMISATTTGREPSSPPFSLRWNSVR
jgi:hypothetical protein